MHIGVDMGGAKIEAIALDCAGRERGRRRIATPRGSYQLIVDAVVGLVEELDADLGVEGTVGLGIPGSLSTLIKQPLDRDLGERLKRPVRLANDANCFGCLRGHRRRWRRGEGGVRGDPRNRGRRRAGGGLSQIDALYQEVPRLWARHVFSDRVDTELRRPKHGDSSGVRGAAWLWSQQQPRES